MLKNMSIHVNGQDRVPPGFRFHPTEEELLHYYLRKKVSYEKIDLDVICDVDLNMLEPWDIPEKCRIGTAHQNDWYFFSHKDKKYPTGTRTNRATAAGFWKATGRDKVIYSSCKRIGMRKTLVFYRGRAPQGQKSDWIMHEYRLDDNTTGDTNVLNDMGDTTQEEGWVVCRLFKKKHFSKTLDSPIISSITTEEIVRTQMLNSSEEGSLEQMVHNYMGNACKEENEANNIKISLNQIATADFNVLHDRFMKLPSLDSPNATSSQTCYLLDSTNDQLELQAGINDWATLDRLIASHLNGQTETSSPSSCFNNEPTSTTMAFSLSPTDHDHLRYPELHRSSFSSTPISDRPPYPSTSLAHHIQNDLWSLITRSFSDSMDQVSNARI